MTTGDISASAERSGAPPDAIILSGLRLMGRCGVLPEEQVRAQPLELDLEVVADLSQPGASDDLDDTVDYGALVDEVHRVVTSGHVALLEKLATRVAEAVLVNPQVTQVTVAVRKLRPPVPHDLASSGVRVTRSRS